ncbi:MAG: hypothetical protein CMP10_08640 [Zetaproteobacteria bacterium]|nr:hypothetical protein [Pseudobdellovibrionaceae bacterium]
MGVSAQLLAKIDERIAAVIPDVQKLRHEIHQHPELTWQEEKTSELLAARLRKIPQLKIRTGVAKYGIVADLVGRHPGPIVALRADMDALPILEKSGRPWTSLHDGKMHACGHDGHMANLMGVAQVLAEMEEHIHGTIRFIFQPAEEGGAGAAVMIDEGALDQVDVIFGMHAWPEGKRGEVLVKTGPIMAANTEIKIKIRGKGAHAAAPHLGTDQVLVAARVVDALQSIPSRFVAPYDAIALTISTIHGGIASNVIPDEVEMTGTLRSVSVETRDRVAVAIENMVTHICAAHGAQGEVIIEHHYPATVNHSEPTDYFRRIARSALGDDAVKELTKCPMTAEDFSYFLEKKPGTFFLLGMAEDGQDQPSLHHPEFDFNDDAFATSMKMFCQLALQWPS